MNAPGKGLLIGAGVALLVFGIIGLISAWAMLEAGPRMVLVSPFVFGMSFRTVYTIILLASITYVIFGIEALVYCGTSNKECCKFKGVCCWDTIFLGCFSILSLIGPGLAILYVVGAAKNKNAVPFRNYATVKKCRQCSATYAGSNIACPHCGSSLYEEIRGNSGANNSVPLSPVASNVGDTWLCKKCDTVNPVDGFDL